MRRFALVTSLLAGSAAAEPALLKGAEIATALTDVTLRYDGAWQRFYASGRTLYNAGRDSWGYWEVRGDAYCSQWPPADGWACYSMARDGEALLFIGESGDVTRGLPE